MDSDALFVLAVRGPWRAVLLDRGGYEVADVDECSFTSVRPADLKLAVVRDTALPIDDGFGPRLPIEYREGDMALYIEGSTFDRPADVQIAWYRIEAMAAGLTMAGEIATKVQPVNT